MALIKTNSQNYTDIANAIRELVSDKTIYDGNITTKIYDDGLKTTYAYTYYLNTDLIKPSQGDVFDVIFNETSYHVEAKISGADTIYLGNGYLWLNSLEDTGEPFSIRFFITDEIKFIIFYTQSIDTYYFKVTGSKSYKKFKPAEMADAIGVVIPEYGVSYNESGTVATTYGYKVAGLAGISSSVSVNISKDATEIGDFAFYGASISDIDLPNGITKIGKYSFGSNDDIHSVRMPDKLVEIGDFAFSGCTFFNTTLPDTVTKIGSYAFSNCRSYLNLSSVPSGVTVIRESTFQFCDKITTFNFHKDIQRIESEAFYYCAYLTDVTFEGTPTQIADDTFERCSRLKTINVPWAEGEVANAPWGATGATINYNYVVE